MGAEGPDRYAILICGRPDDAVCSSCGGFEDMFLRLLREEGRAEDWRLYRAFEGELPTQQELSSLRGLVITGSVADAFGSDDWLVALRQTVRAAIDQQKQVLGVCFGHQLVGTVLGAKVGRAGCWEVGARRVQAAPGAREAVAAAGGGAWAALLPDSLCLHEFHQDQVLEVPRGATLLASSERCPVEMFAVGRHVLCIQGHPEFDAEVVRQLAEPRLEAIGGADVARMTASLAALPAAADAPALRALCLAFLKGPNP